MATDIEGLIVAPSVASELSLPTLLGSCLLIAIKMETLFFFFTDKRLRQIPSIREMIAIVHIVPTAIPISINNSSLTGK